MQVTRLQSTINVNCTPNKAIQSFGFCPTPEEAKIFRYLHKKAPGYCRAWDKKMFKLPNNTPDSSDLRDALMRRALAKAQVLMAKELERKALFARHPFLAKLDSTYVSFKNLFKPQPTLTPSKHIV